MNQILAEYSSSISELKRNPAGIIEEAKGAPIAILSHNKPVAYLIPSNTYEMLLEELENKMLAEIALSREGEYDQAIEVDLDDL